MSNNTTIQVRLGSVEVTCNDVEQFESVLRSIKAQLPELVRMAPTDDGPAIADVLAQSQARTFGEKAGVIAYWLEHHRGRTDWRSGDVLDALRDAGEATPANITDALNQKLKKGLFEVSDRRWKLTGEGRGWVKYRLLNESGD